MNPQPLVSIIIPTFKDRGGLKPAIMSALEQDYPKIEIIIIDDNDPTSEYRKCTEELMKSFSNINYVKYIKHPKNLNGAVARNTGIQAAKGDIISFLDDDDTFFTDKISKQVDYLLKSSFQAVYCGARIDNKDEIPYLEGNLSKELLLLQTRMYTPAILMYKTVANQLDGFDSKFIRHQDFEFLLRFFISGNQIGCVKESLISIGINIGENQVRGNQLDNLKMKFLSDFENIISEIDNNHRGFKKKVYITHYSQNIVSHVRNGFFYLAIRLTIKLLKYDPIYFTYYCISYLLKYFMKKVK